LPARIFEDSAGHFEETLVAAAGLDAAPVERLCSFARECSLWYLRNIERTAIYVNEWEHLSGKRLKEVKRIRIAYQGRLAGMIAEVKDAGDAAPDLDIGYATYFIFGALNGLPTWYRRRGPDPAERIADRYAEMIAATVVSAAKSAPLR
jgi:hypothetical protein